MANGGKCVSVCGRVQCLHALVGCRPPVVVSMTNFPSTCCDDVGSIGLLHTQCVQWMQNLLGIKRRRFFTACVLNLLEPMQTRTNISSPGYLLIRKLKKLSYVTTYDSSFDRTLGPCQHSPPIYRSHAYIIYDDRHSPLFE